MRESNSLEIIYIYIYVHTYVCFLLVVFKTTSSLLCLTEVCVPHDWHLHQDRYAH